MFVDAQSPSQHLERSKSGPGATSQLRTHALWLFALEEVKRLRVERLEQGSKQKKSTSDTRAPALFYKGQHGTLCTRRHDTPDYTFRTTAIPTQWEATAFDGWRIHRHLAIAYIGSMGGGRHRASMHADGVYTHVIVDCAKNRRSTRCRVLRSCVLCENVGDRCHDEIDGAIPSHTFLLRLCTRTIRALSESSTNVKSIVQGMIGSNIFFQS